MRFFRTIQSVNGGPQKVDGAQEVDWLRDWEGPKTSRFFSLPDDVSIRKIDGYEEGLIVGMDAASVATVWALNPQPGMKCLDLCCAPGMKLALIAECVEPTGHVVGVDMSLNRLRIAKNLLGKFRVKNGTLLCGDGTKFPSECVLVESAIVNERRRLRQKLKSKHRRLILEASGSPRRIGADELFDAVLVDAECTHDGSLKHMNKNESFVWQNRREGLQDLQRSLILNGFNRVKPDGGILVYSTCSVQRAQNEDIVNYLIETVGEQRALLSPLPFSLAKVPATPIEIRRRLDCACIFKPEDGFGGQFIARITRQDCKNSSSLIISQPS